MIVLIRVSGVYLVFLIYRTLFMSYLYFLRVKSDRVVFFSIERVFILILVAQSLCVCELDNCFCLLSYHRELLVCFFTKSYLSVCVCVSLSACARIS